MKKSNIKYTVLAFVLGVGMSIGGTVYGKLAIGSSTQFVNKDGTRQVQMTQAEADQIAILPVEAVNVRQGAIPNKPVNTVTDEEARLRSIEARLTALENK